MSHAGRYAGGTALIVLGGHSAVNWRDLYLQLQPDVIIGANGVNGLVYDLDYWVLAENMTRSAGLAKRGDAKSIELMNMFHRDSGAKYKMVSHWSWNLLQDTRNCISIRRQGRDVNEMEGFTLRDYGMGFLAGWLQKSKEAGALVHTGTVGAQCLHLAGILGCAEVHTIGYDLMFKDKERHHAYKYPVYEVDRFRTPAFHPLVPSRYAQSPAGITPPAVARIETFWVSFGVVIFTTVTSAIIFTPFGLSRLASQRREFLCQFCLSLLF